METCIAVDVGGTKMLVAEAREDGSLVQVLRIATGQMGKAEIVEKMINGILEYESLFGWENRERPGRIGIGINGVIDPVRGVWKKLGPDDKEMPVRERIEQEFSCECFVDNDVKCTVMAEHRFGAAKGCLDVVYLNVGTGLAAGVIANGKVIRGTDGFAGEVGFMNFTGGKGPRVELLASGMGLSGQARTLKEEYPPSPLTEKENGTISGQEVFELAKQGDALSARILDDMVRMNALMISNLTCVLSPEIVVLGGGLIASGLLLDRIRAEVLPKAASHLEKGIVLTGLDPGYAGLMGAAVIGLGWQESYSA